jgi:hypothetical protein
MQTAKERREAELRACKTVGEIIKLLQEALAIGQCTEVTPCMTQGCDCVGPCEGIAIQDGVLYFERGE